MSRTVRMRAAIVTTSVVVALGACRPRPPVEIATTPSAGVSIMLYQLGDQSYSVVDDRRWVDVRDGILVLEKLDPGATLPTLVLESLGGSTLVVGACSRDIAEAPEETPKKRATREPVLDFDDVLEAVASEPPIDAGDIPAGAKSDAVIATSAVRCAVTGPAGKHLVRVLYVSSTLSYRAQHDIAMTAAEHAMLTTRYTIATPAWGGKADVVLYDGMPGREQAPVEIARGQVVLDGSIAVLATPTRAIDARLRRVYSGEMSNTSNDDDSTSDSVNAVWVWLELELARLASGPVHATVRLVDEDEHDVEVPQAGREQGARSMRVPLWIDPSLRGSKVRRRVGRENADMAEWFSVAITNTGTQPREVWIEQTLQEGARRRLVTYGQPTKPTLGAKRARAKLVVAPQRSARLAYTITYTY
ncbi:MAG: hypothetical protein ACKV2T_40270 [Kofleriaceae bacterium]